MSKKKRAQEQLEAIQDQLKSINNQLESNRETMTEIAKAGIDYSFKIDKIRGISERYGRAYGIGMGICVGVLGNIFASLGLLGFQEWNYEAFLVWAVSGLVLLTFFLLALWDTRKLMRELTA